MSAGSPVTPPPSPPQEGEGDNGYFAASSDTPERERATAMMRSPRFANASTTAAPNPPVAPKITVRSLMKPPPYPPPRAGEGNLPDSPAERVGHDPTGSGERHRHRPVGRSASG